MKNENKILFESLMDLLSVINSPQSDDKLLKFAGVDLDRAMLPLLYRIGLRGPISINDLADQVGREQSTVSRQIQKLEALKLIKREIGPLDSRIRVLTITKNGQNMLNAIGKARDQLTNTALKDWSLSERQNLNKLLRKLADSVAESMNGKL